MTEMIVLAGIGLCIVIFIVWAIDSLVCEFNELKVIKGAMEDTGIRGELFSVALPKNKIAIAGVVMSVDEAKKFFYQYKDGYQIIMERVGDQTVEVFRRKPRAT